MRKIRVYELALFPLVFMLIALGQVSAETVGEYCRRTTPPEDSHQPCIDDFGGNPNTYHGTGPESEDDATPQNETVGEYCRRTTLPEESHQPCIDDFGGDPSVLYSSGNGVIDNGDGGIGSGDGGGSGSSGGSASSSGSSGSGGNERRTSVSTASPPPLLDYVDHSVVVAENAFFQPVTGGGIGNSTVIARGVVSATDVWGMVPPGTRVCFIGRLGSAVAFLDANTSPRALSWLDYYIDGHDTCVDLPGAGTVVLTGPMSAPAPPAPAVDVLPPATCQIKLTETLFLRAQPAGEIIGLVWLYSEVPVYAVEGHWYSIEFEGQYGYISRYHRNVLRGSC